MRRRDFIALLGGGAFAPIVLAPLATRAEKTSKLPAIGFLGTPSASAWTPWTAAFIERLRELGWVDGRTVTIEFRWAEGRADRFTEIATEFARRKVDVIVTSGTAVLETEKVTSTIPIVFAVASDPLGTGMVASLARPGGNATGLSLQSPDLAGKRLEQLRAAVPAVHRLAVLANVSYRAALLEMDDVKTTVAKTGLETVDMAIRRAEDIEPAFKAVKGRVDAIYVCGSEALVNNNRVRIATLALGARLPTLYPEKQYVKAGGLMSYGATIPNMFRRAAEIVDKILHGANPADIPVEQPTKFELVVNLKTANSLGLTVPPTLLALADEVIE